MNNELKILNINNIDEIRIKLGLSPKKYLYTIVKNELKIYKNNALLKTKVLA